MDDSWDSKFGRTVLCLFGWFCIYSFFEALSSYIAGEPIFMYGKNRSDWYATGNDRYFVLGGWLFFSLTLGKYSVQETLKLLRRLAKLKKSDVQQAIEQKKSEFERVPLIPDAKDIVASFGPDVDTFIAKTAPPDELANLVLNTREEKVFNVEHGEDKGLRYCYLSFRNDQITNSQKLGTVHSQWDRDNDLISVELGKLPSALSQQLLIQSNGERWLLEGDQKFTVVLSEEEVTLDVLSKVEIHLNENASIVGIEVVQQRT